MFGILIITVLGYLLCNPPPSPPLPSPLLEKSQAVADDKLIRKEAWLFCRTSSGVRLCWELEEPEGPKEKLRMVRMRMPPARPLEVKGLLAIEDTQRPRVLR